MRLPCISGGNSGKDIDFEETTRMLRFAIDNGVNYVDTAYPYHGGASEGAVGKALADGYRQRVFLADKSPVFRIRQASDFDTFLDEQLTRLGDEHIDLYLLHSLSAETWENVVLKFGILDKAERARQAGKIGHIGFSFHDSFEVFEKILNDYDGFEFGQIQLNYLDTNYQAGLKGLQLLQDRGLGAAIMEPLLGGKLARPPQPVRALFETADSRRTPVQWAFDFLWDMEAVSVVLSGMSTMQQVKDNLTYADAPGSLSDTERFAIAEARRQFSSLLTVPCTACGYCMPCPSGVNIPSNFEAYNDLYMYDSPETGQNTFATLIRWQGRQAAAASCVACRACEKKCPQHIEISRLMPQVAQAFQNML
jgi:predicted aldo/keto reductase-like oxidoreductase